MDQTQPKTPEFLCWAVEQQCPLRELLPTNNPEKVERQLRGARAVSEARAEGRVQDDLAISADQTLGFRIADALAIFGGEETVEKCCGECPANACAAVRQPSYAGCYGLFPLPAPREAFLRRIQNFPRDQRLFLPTKWVWYGWWIRSPLGLEQMEYLATAVGALASEDEFAGNRDLSELVAALRLCINIPLPMSVQFFPAGQIDGVWWNLLPHCPVCHAPWELAGGVCAICGQARHPASSKKRRVRGTRPYRRLEEIT